MPATAETLGQRLRTHPLYRAIRVSADLSRFMEHHVVCVWDFMSLLKSLQREVTCIDVPWVPPSDSLSARLINEIVLDEESDSHGAGYVSHFELYIAAMEEQGANTGPILDLIDLVRDGRPAFEAIRQSRLPLPCKRFLASTLQLTQLPLHCRAAAFYYGRESVIPDMFSGLIAGMRAAGVSCPRLTDYLDRHIETDGERHAPLAKRLMDTSIGGDPIKEREANDAATTALSARLALWDATARSILARPGPAAESPQLLGG